jgi:predicted dehydrogenase
LAFHTNLNVPDEHRRFCIMGAKGMAEGDFVRGYLNITRRDGSSYARHDYTQGDAPKVGNHYGADQLMVRDILSYLDGTSSDLPVSLIDALEAGIAALALDQARSQRTIVELADIWQQFDSYNLRAIL